MRVFNGRRPERRQRGQAKFRGVGQRVSSQRSRGHPEPLPRSPLPALPLIQEGKKGPAGKSVHIPVCTCSSYDNGDIEKSWKSHVLVVTSVPNFTIQGLVPFWAVEIEEGACPSREAWADGMGPCDLSS